MIVPISRRKKAAPRPRRRGASPRVACGGPRPRWRPQAPVAAVAGCWRRSLWAPAQTY